MDETTIAISVARGRIAFGMAALAAPKLAARAMSGTKQSAGLAPMFARMFGARDIALGLGTIVAIDRGAPVRGWLEGGALADSADLLACTLARNELTPAAFKAAAALAGGAALLGVFLSRRLDPPPPPHPARQVGDTGLEPVTSALSRQRSPS
jgi:hypothetical protein